MFKIISSIFVVGLVAACGDAQFEGQSFSSSSKEQMPLESAIDNPDLLAAHACNNSQKVLICHVPPGNPANKHTLCIGRSAVEAHLHNHEADNDESDYLGACRGDVQNPGEPQLPEEPENNL